MGFANKRPSSFLSLVLLVLVVIHAVSAQSGNAFNIQIHYLNDVRPQIQEIFESAKQRWERVLIHSDIETPYTIRRYQFICEFYAPETVEVDDLLIYVKILSIDGQGNTLGQAGPCGVDRNRRVRVGYMELDLDDIEAEIQNERANITIIHEIGHILGIGTLWDLYRLLGESDDHELGDYKIRYIGEQGNIGNEEVGMKYEAVIEDSGGRGTARSHWEEDIYEDELMTGYVPSSGVILMSRLTIRALADLGFTVDIDQADDFEVDPDIVEDLEWEDARAISKRHSNLRGSKPKKDHRNKQSYGQDVLHLPITILETELKPP